MIALALAAGVAGCTRATPEQQVIADAASALGGVARVAAVTTLVLEGEGTHWNVGQDMTIDATGQTFAVTGYRRAVDLDAGRMRVQQTRTPNFLYFQGQAAQTQVFGLDGDVAYAVGANGTASRTGAQAVRDRQTELYHHPVVLVRAALDRAEKEGLTVAPWCPFARKWLEEHPDDAARVPLDLESRPGS